MELSVAYVQPVIEWLRAHPEWAAIIVFFISFLESLAVIGSIVPGSVMMTMVGILAGTGVIELKSSLIAAILGAIAGDGGSYFLGYYFSERLAQLWPFSRYPSWLSYGKSYFERHGGKSVFLGRFVGPLRSLIPAIAGMMKMKHLHFFIANVFSAIGWSMLYLGPGILVGAASATLSAEITTRLFLVIIGLLLGLWLFGVGIKKIGARLRNVFGHFLHTLWSHGKKIKILRPLLNMLTPLNETHHAQTFFLLLSCIVLSMVSLLLLQDIFHEPLCLNLDLPIYFFLQSIRTPAFDAFFTTMLLLISPASIFAIVFTQIGYSIVTQQTRLAQYWLSLCLFTLIMLFSFNHYFIHHHSELLNISQGKLLIPVHHLGFATAILSFFMLTAPRSCSPLIQKTLRWSLSLLIIFASIALLYLGENWFSSVFDAVSMALSLSLLHWLFYRRIDENPPTQFTVGLASLSYGFTSICIIFLSFHHTLNDHKPNNTQYMLTHEAWWEQDKPILPMYSSNRLGRPDGLFNIQYLGSIQHLEHALSVSGWRKQSTSLVKNLIAKADKNPSKLSLKGQFYLNQKPDLVMSYGKKGAKPILLLSLWRSNFHLLHHFHPLWIGTIQPYHRSKLTSKSRALVTIPFNPLLHALREFKIRTFNITNSELPAYGASVKLLIIEDQL